MKVLIVDDSHNVAETIADYLELEGMVIDCAYHGEAALKLASDNYYDCLLYTSPSPRDLDLSRMPSSA